MHQEDHYSEKHFLNNDRFLLWRVSPDSELDTYWNNYIKTHPEYLDGFNRAIEIMSSVKMNEYSLSSKETDGMYALLQQEFKKKSKGKTRRLIFNYAAAACFALLCVIGSLYYIHTSSSLSNQLAAVADMKIDSTQVDVELIIRNDKKMILAEQSTIKYNSQGKVLVNDKEADVENKAIEGESNINTLKVPYGKRSVLILEDGTKVWVNSGTTLQFPSSFEPNKRTISVNGEIYIEVAKDANRPFFIKTSSFDVRVLGTKFNITAYCEDATQQLVLVQGSVEVNTAAKQQVIMRPNELFCLTNNKVSTKMVDVYDYISWKDGLFKFNSQSLDVVLHRLSRYYRLKINCDEASKKKICSGKLVLFDDFDSVMKTISEILPIQYERKGDVINISSNP